MCFGKCAAAKERMQNHVTKVTFVPYCMPGPVKYGQYNGEVALTPEMYYARICFPPSAARSVLTYPSGKSWH